MSMIRINLKNCKTVCCLLFVFVLFFPIEQFGQSIDERKIFLMRTKQFLGSGNRMDILVNGNSIYELKNGRRLIIKTKVSETVEIQIVYPLMKKYKSNTILIVPKDEKNIYLDAYYFGAGKDFSIELNKMDSIKGEKIFFQSEFFKDNNITEINVP